MMTTTRRREVQGNHTGTTGPGRMSTLLGSPKKEIKEPRPVPPGDKDLGIKTGVVKTFDEYDRPGFGHLLDSNNCEYFVHYTDIKGGGYRNLARGQHVKFHAYEGDKGLYAKEVSVITVDR